MAKWTVVLSGPPNSLPKRFAAARWGLLALLLTGCQCAPAPTADAGTPSDAGTPYDAGAPPDSGAPIDGGSLDAGVSDAGSPDSGRSFYGPGIGADSLDNHQVAAIDVDIRFRAATTAHLLSMRWYDIYTIKCAPHGTVDAGTCPLDCAPSGGVYACGNGGTMHICVQGDDGSTHLADGVDLACLDHVNASGPPFFPLETFPTPAALDAGTLYHLHWHNTDATPDTNFTSVDGLYVMKATVPRQPAFADLDLALFRGTTPRPNDTPILQLAYDDGTVQWQGYMEVWVGTPVDIHGDAGVREQFTVSGPDRAVSEISVRLNVISGTSPLGLLVETAAGVPLATARIPASAFPAGAPAVVSAGWATASLSPPVTLQSGQAYHLVLSAPADTDYQAFGLERGDGYQFTVPTFFNDGYGEFTVDGSTWVGFTQPGGRPNNTNADLPFYFE